MSVFNVRIGERLGPWPLDLDTMSIDEAEQCEKLTGWTALQWRDALTEYRARAVKFAVWLARRRAGDAQEWAEVDFDLYEVTIDRDLEDDGEPAPADLGVGEDEAAVVPTGHATETGSEDN